MATTAQANAVPAGAYFGLPGFTNTFEQYENLNNISTNLALAAQTPFNPPGSFQKTDVIKFWELECAFNVTTTFTGATLSPWAPYNLLQAFKLQLQGQYSPIEVESGIDAWFFQVMRPMRGPGQRTVQDLGGVNLATTYANSAIPQTNQMTSGIATNPAAGTTWNFMLEIPGGIYLDQYWDIAQNGALQPNASGVVAPVSAWVSPQYMGGGERVVVPKIQFASLNASTSDSGPLVGSTAGAANLNMSARRSGYYASANAATLPPVFNWQYRRASKRYPIGGASKIDIPITEYGQLFSTFVRLYDGTGNAPITVSNANITKCQLLTGSNLPKFDDDVEMMQNRFIQQHGFVPPQGFVVWDMLASTSGSNLSNDARIVNTLTTANTHIHLEFASVQTAGAYAVIGTELLVPVATQ